MTLVAYTESQGVIFGWPGAGESVANNRVSWVGAVKHGTSSCQRSVVWCKKQSLRGGNRSAAKSEVSSLHHQGSEGAITVRKANRYLFRQYFKNLFLIQYMVKAPKELSV